jgi:hypothetical protein
MDKQSLGHVFLQRSLHNYLNFPFPGLPQNEGLGTINQRIPPKLFGGDDPAKKTSKNLRKIIINIRYSLTNNYISAIFLSSNFFLEELWDTNKWIGI